MFEYYQGTGKLFHYGRVVSQGYSGRLRGKNNPALQRVRGIGPIPQGDWHIVSIRNHPTLGPRCITLYAADEPIPDDYHEETVRSLFRVHGDSIKNPGTASRGCIILPREAREYMWKHRDSLLRVMP